MQFVLAGPPEGISLPSASPELGGVSVTFRVDPTKVKPGLKGNLIIEMYSEAVDLLHSLTSAETKTQHQPVTRHEVPERNVGAHCIGVP